MGKVITIASGKGGVGKTTLCALLGVNLASHYNKSVCLVDADFGLGNLDCLLGLENRYAFDLIDVINERCRLFQVLQQSPIVHNLYFLPSIKLENSNKIKLEDFKEVIRRIAEFFDYVIIDSPAGIDYGFKRAILPCDEVLLVATPTLTSIKDGLRVIEHLKANESTTIKLIVNRARKDLVKKRKMISPQEIESVLQLPLIGVVPESLPLYMLSQVTSLSAHIDKEVFSAIEEVSSNIVYDKIYKFNSYSKIGSELLDIKSLKNRAKRI